MGPGMSAVADSSALSTSIFAAMAPYDLVLFAAGLAQNRSMLPLDGEIAPAYCSPLPPADSNQVCPATLLPVLPALPSRTFSAITFPLGLASRSEKMAGCSVKNVWNCAEAPLGDARSDDCASASSPIPSIENHVSIFSLGFSWACGAQTSDNDNAAMATNEREFLQVTCDLSCG